MLIILKLLSSSVEQPNWKEEQLKKKMKIQTVHSGNL